MLNVQSVLINFHHPSRELIKLTFRATNIAVRILQVFQTGCTCVSVNDRVGGVTVRIIVNLVKYSSTVYITKYRELQNY